MDEATIADYMSTTKSATASSVDPYGSTGVVEWCAL